MRLQHTSFPFCCCIRHSVQSTQHCACLVPVIRVQLRGIGCARIPAGPVCELCRQAPSAACAQAYLFLAPFLVGLSLRNPGGGFGNLGAAKIWLAPGCNRREGDAFRSRRDEKTYRFVTPCVPHLRLANFFVARDRNLACAVARAPVWTQLPTPSGNTVQCV